MVNPPGSGDGGGPEDVLSLRVSRLEDDMAEVKSALTRMEPILSEMRANLGHMASKSDTVSISGEIQALSAKLESKADAEVVGEIKGALSKLPTLATIAILCAVVGALYAAYKFLVHHYPSLG